MIFAYGFFIFSFIYAAGWILSFNEFEEWEESGILIMHISKIGIYVCGLFVCGSLVLHNMNGSECLGGVPTAGCVVEVIE